MIYALDTTYEVKVIELEKYAVKVSNLQEQIQHFITQFKWYKLVTIKGTYRAWGAADTGAAAAGVEGAVLWGGAYMMWVF